jgi:hypothetical protein
MRLRSYVEEERTPGEVSVLRRLRQLEGANGRLNRLVIDLQTRQAYVGKGFPKKV